jgi:hypothetical protein
VPQGKPAPLKSLFSGIAKEEHPSPANRLGQAPCLPSAGWMRQMAKMAINYFPKSFAASKINSFSSRRRPKFHCLFSTSRLVVGLFPVCAFMANFRTADHLEVGQTTPYKRVLGTNPPTRRHYFPFPVTRPSILNSHSPRTNAPASPTFAVVATHRSGVVVMWS